MNAHLRDLDWSRWTKSACASRVNSRLRRPPTESPPRKRPKTKTSDGESTTDAKMQPPLTDGARQRRPRGWPGERGWQRRPRGGPEGRAGGGALARSIGTGKREELSVCVDVIGKFFILLSSSIPSRRLNSFLHIPYK